MVVIRDEVENTFSRRDLVLTMANRDGGAHVDPVLTTKYAMLSRQHSLGWRSRIAPDPYEPISHPERVAVRQVAHEVLKSLDPSYTKDANVEPPYFVAYNVLVMYEPLKKFEVNEPCPCGSGKKYKKCHGAPTTVRRSSLAGEGAQAPTSSPVLPSPPSPFLTFYIMLFVWEAK
jgi:hypothetical protein